MNHSRAPRIVSFRGFEFDTSQVVAVDPVTSTSEVAGLWEFGCVVRLAGNSITVVHPRPARFGYGGGPSQAEYLSEAEAMRKALLKIIWP